MIRSTDDVLLSIQIIHNYWKQSPRMQMAVLPKIPDSTTLDMLKDFLNKHLFESGLMQSSAYRAMYRVEDWDRFQNLSWNQRVYQAKAKMDEMFCGTDVRLPIIQQQ